MLQRQILLVSCVVASCFVSTPLITKANPTPTEIPSSVVVPISTPVSPVEPLPPGSDLELPAIDPGKIKPQYQEQPIAPQEQSLRLVIQLSRRRVTVYRGSTAVKSYSIAVGKPGWETPKGTYKVQQMFRNPTWIHPLQKGITIAGGDPENPLGRFWIGFWTDGKNWIGFHGTPNQASVGSAASHGCIRMYNKDIEELFSKVSLGTEVKVVQ